MKMRERFIHNVCLTVFCLIALQWLGCLTKFARRDVQIRVVDAQTAAPLDAAQIQVAYGEPMTRKNVPFPDRALTAFDGRALMRLPVYRGPVRWLVTRDGYISQRGTGLLSDTVPEDWPGTPLLITDKVVTTFSLTRAVESTPR